jgi:branched-chain amino acid transport system substrate-binding protein
VGNDFRSWGRTLQEETGPQNTSPSGGREEGHLAAWVSFAGRDRTIERYYGDDAGAELLQQCPQLVDYASSFLISERNFVQFYWKDDSRHWLNVCLERSKRPTHVRVTMKRGPLPGGLTSREIDVLSLLAGGLSNREIAECLFLSVRTVSTHLEHILNKLGESGRAGAAAAAAERGWLRLPIPGHGAPMNSLTVSLLHSFASAGAKHQIARAVRRGTVQRRPLLVGSVIPLSGPASADGREMLGGSTMAISELNSRGGVAGRWIEHMVVDTDIFSVSDVERAFGELAEAGVDAITSGYIFMESAAREAAAKYGAPYLHSMTSESHARIVTDDPARYAGIFQICPTEIHYASSFLHFVSELRNNGRWQQRSGRIAFIETALPSGQMVNETTFQSADRLGLEISLLETVEPIGVDWSVVVDQIVRADPAAVMITQFLASELAAFQREITHRAPHILVFAVYSPSIPEFLELAGSAAEGMVWTTVTGTYSDSIGQHFEQQFNRLCGRRPGRSQAGLAYDGIHLLAQAWASVPEPANHPVVASQLRLSRYRGVNGAYSLNNPSQSGLNFPYTTTDPSLGQAHLVFQVQDGEHRIVGPVPYAEATVRC